ncbi:uncharacterized mitochondrial protein-like protein [Tanacetum coccineum]
MVYVDDIIFGSTNKDLCTRFEKLMKDKFQMSSMGELTFFLGLQVQQKEDGIFIIDLEKPLVKDGDADDVDVHLYRSMIGSLMYLTTSRPDIMFAVRACARFQVTPKTSHLLAIKRFFRYLIDKPTLGLWYSRDSPFELFAYTDSDYAGATQDRKSTSAGCQFWVNKLISWQCMKQTVVATSTTEAEYVATANLLTKCFNVRRHVKRGRDIKIPRSSGPPVKVGDEAVHKELGERMESAATTASSLEAEQYSGSGLRYQDTILGDVLDLEKAKSDQAIEIASLKKRVDKQEKRRKFKTTGLKRLKKVGAARRIETSNDSLGAQEDASKQERRIEDIDVDAEVTLVNETQERQDEDLMFDIGVLDGDEMFVDATTGEKDEQSTKLDDSTAGEAVTTTGVEDSALPTIPTTVEETLAQTLMEIKAAKPKAKGIVFYYLEKQTLTKKDQVALDEDLARNIQAQLDAEIIEDERLERQKQVEANIELIESWENTHAMMDANRLLAEKLQTRERERS